jgi:signal transduction histidine kinase
MNRLIHRLTRSGSGLLLASCLASVTLVTFGLGFWATEQWRHTSQAAADTRGEETAALLGAALKRDMYGAQISVLLPITHAMVSSGPLYDLADEFARGFARYPYLESFFVCRRTDTGLMTHVFGRSDRRPSWNQSDAPDDAYPVQISQNAPFVETAVAPLQDDARRQLQFAIHEFSIAGQRYQAFSRLFYEAPPPSTGLSAVIGFVVNVEWVRGHYFRDFIGEMENVVGDRHFGIRVVDDAGGVIAAVGPTMSRPAKHLRRFPPSFFDPALVRALDAHETRDWKIEVDSTSEAALSAATFGASRLLALLAVATALTLAALVLTVRATAATATLVAAQSEFVSAVTHEMKTPLALFRLASDTLATGRYDSEQTVPDYGRLMAAEAGRLTRLIDNVLCYARLDSLASRYHFEHADLAELIEECVNRWRVELQAAGLTVTTNLLGDGADVCVDRIAIHQVFDNLIDNAARHARSGRTLNVTVERRPGAVTVAFADAGPGIAPADLPRIFERFYRGGNTVHRGSGLGLAIVRHIVEDHGGTITVESVVRHGTTFRIVLPASEERDIDGAA